MEFRVLGEIEAARQGKAVDLGHLRQRRVLAALLVDANRELSTDTLVERVWGDQAPSKAHATVYSYVYRLRQALAPDVTIVRKSGCYVLTVDPASVDMHQFRDLVDRARAESDDRRARALFDQALALWRGEPFARTDTPWFTEVRDALEQECLAARLDRNDIVLRQGDHAELLPELTALAAGHPLHERLAGQLMLALYRGGRTSESLEHYQGIRRRLADELGIDPSPPLTELYERILSAEPAVDVRVPDLAPVPGTRRTARPSAAAAIWLAALLFVPADAAPSVPDSPMPALPEDGDYRIMLAHTGMCLSERSGTPSGLLYQTGCEHSIPAMALRKLHDDVYQVATDHPDFGPGCMGVAPGALEPEAPVADGYCEPGVVQEFRIEPAGTGFHIRPTHSGLCLGVRENSTEDWAPVVQLECDASATGQVFLFRPRP